MNPNPSHTLTPGPPFSTPVCLYFTAFVIEFAYFLWLFGTVPPIPMRSTLRAGVSVFWVHYGIPRTCDGT